MTTSPTATRLRYRPCSCLVCLGTGREVAGIAPGDRIVLRDCWWCDGRGTVLQPTDPDPRPRCSACHRPTVDYAGMAVCPTCTVVDLADFEE